MDDDHPTWEPAVDDTVPMPGSGGEEPTADYELSSTAAPPPPPYSPYSPPPPPPSPPAGGAPGRAAPTWLWPALIAALVGALVAGGLVAAFGRTTTTRTVTNFGPNSSKLVTGDVQSVLAKVEPGVVNVQTQGFSQNEFFQIGRAHV